MTNPIDMAKTVGFAAGLETHRRSIAKAITYRLLGTAVTAGTAWALTSQLTVALSLGALDLGGKIAIYYLHERIWERVSYGRARPPEYNI